jgi:hypothetical protein
VGTQVIHGNDLAVEANDHQMLLAELDSHRVGTEIRCARHRVPEMPKRLIDPMIVVGLLNRRLVLVLC